MLYSSFPPCGFKSKMQLPATPFPCCCRQDATLRIYSACKNLHENHKKWNATGLRMMDTVDVAFMLKSGPEVSQAYRTVRRGEPRLAALPRARMHTHAACMLVWADEPCGTLPGQRPWTRAGTGVGDAFSGT